VLGSSRCRGENAAMMCPDSFPAATRSRLEWEARSVQERTGCGLVLRYFYNSAC